MSPFTKGGGCLCVVFCVRDRMFGEYSRRGLVCTYAKSCVLPHLCAKERVCVCCRPSCQTAAIFVSQTGREAGEARRSFEVLFSPESSIRPEEICHVVPPFWFPYGGAEGKGICSYLLSTSQYTHTYVCNRPVKVTKRFVWPCCETLSLPFLSLVWDRSGPSSCSSPILDRTYFIIYPPTPWLYTGLFCLQPDLSFSFFQSAGSIIHSCFLQNFLNRSPIPFFFFYLSENVH